MIGVQACSKARRGWKIIFIGLCHVKNIAVYRRDKWLASTLYLIIIYLRFCWQSCCVATYIFVKFIIIVHYIVQGCFGSIFCKPAWCSANAAQQVPISPFGDFYPASLTCNTYRRNYSTPLLYRHTKHHNFRFWSSLGDLGSHQLWIPKSKM